MSPEISILKILGAGIAISGVCLGYTYRHTFDQDRFEKWRDKHLKRFPDAEDGEQGAPLGLFLKPEYLRRLKYGKLFGLLLTIFGIILGIFA